MKTNLNTMSTVEKFKIMEQAIQQDRKNTFEVGDIVSYSNFSGTLFVVTKVTAAFVTYQKIEWEKRKGTNGWFFVYPKKDTMETGPFTSPTRTKISVVGKGEATFDILGYMYPINGTPELILSSHNKDINRLIILN